MSDRIESPMMTLEEFEAAVEDADAILEGSTRHGIRSPKINAATLARLLLGLRSTQAEFRKNFELLCRTEADLATANARIRSQAEAIVRSGTPSSSDRS
jgi:hypothetical protein